MRTQRQTYVNDRKALADAKIMLQLVEFNTNEFAEVICGRLKNVYPKTLIALKHELANFSTKTCKWNPPKQKRAAADKESK